MRVDRVIVDVKTTVRKLVEALDNWLTFEENLQCSRITVITPHVTDVEFTVQHKLGRVPFGYIVNIDNSPGGPAVVYNSRKSSWTQQQMFLKCTQPSAEITLIVL